MGAKHAKYNLVAPSTKSGLGWGKGERSPSCWACFKKRGVSESILEAHGGLWHCLVWHQPVCISMLFCLIFHSSQASVVLISGVHFPRNAVRPPYQVQNNFPAIAGRGVYSSEIRAQMDGHFYRHSLFVYYNCPGHFLNISLFVYHNCGRIFGKRDGQKKAKNGRIHIPTPDCRWLLKLN